MALTIREVLEQLIKPVGMLDATVDTLKSGDPEVPVTGVVVTFMATQYAIQQAISLGANLIITHEALYYNHHDQTKAFEQDPVVQEKQRLIDESGIAVFRYHDYGHRRQPDIITNGLIKALGWQDYVQQNQAAASILAIPDMTVIEIAEHAKRQLNLPYVRVAGDSDLLCRRVGISVGYRGGGELLIPLFEEGQLELVIAGEGPEWETPEYIRDAVYQGRNKALLMLGHAESEMPGMKLLAEELSQQYPQLPVHFVSDQPVYGIL